MKGYYGNGYDVERLTLLVMVFVVVHNIQGCWSDDYIPAAAENTKKGGSRECWMTLLNFCIVGLYSQEQSQWQKNIF